ncbi:TrmB family transcriptional regulator [Natronomonas salina]|uniref:TrmB family transcriptional regulator n=1 Tax=Natronomonas salina TaxID=1710540 RepID=UPI0015B6381A|nr:TrmB family transcriptional regulator [Natronomonas salina]QLD89546.1 TrmB family transcriptional regulator [Natronomonas salina]
MPPDQPLEEATELLQQFGLKEYEARSFVGLSRLDAGTAKELSEITDVPRTRIYDAVKALEELGLVEVHHSSPKRFRAVTINEATETLRKTYEGRISQLQDSLERVDRAEVTEETPVQEVWSISGQPSIETRANTLISSATDEIVLVIGDESLLTQGLITTLNDVGDGAEIIIGALTESLREQIQGKVPEATTFISGLEWLHGPGRSEKDTEIGRLLLADRSAILVSTLVLATESEHAIFGEGFGNGMIVIARRLLSQGLLPRRDPGV